MRGSGDLKDLQPEFLELRTHELSQFLGLGHIDLVQNHDARAFGNRDGTQRQLELVGVERQLVFQRVVVGHRVAVRFKRGAIDHMGDDFGTFDVAQELQSQALAFGGARNQARTSAMVYRESPAITTPRFGTSVVNG